MRKNTSSTVCDGPPSPIADARGRLIIRPVFYLISYEKKCAVAHYRASSSPSISTPRFFTARYKGASFENDSGVDI